MLLRIGPPDEDQVWFFARRGQLRKQMCLEEVGLKYLPGSIP
jgi:hypothetical protein